ncbi:MAG: DUF1559 domain-containing protein, partial [Planctomycetes bacterium]|nr:DUF1559 domain-containing protein [Planctomycetota bacterium]
PWMHGIATTPEGEKQEFWLATSRGLAASRCGQFVQFCDLRLGETYQYDPGKQTLLRLPPNDLEAEEFRLVEALLAGFLRGDQELKLPDSSVQLVRQQRREIQDDGRNWLEYTLEFHAPRVSPNDLTMIYRVDPATGLPREMTLHRGGAPSSLKVALDYPDSGPTDVYALGVPRDAKLVDRVPQGDLQRILAAGKVGRQQIGSYAGVILESLPPQAGKPMDIVTAFRIWRDGRRWRIALVWQEDLMRLRQKIWKGEVKVPDSEAAGLAWWKAAVNSMRCEPQFVSDGKTAYRFKFCYVADPQTGRLDFQVDGAEPDYLQLSPTDAMPSVNVLPEQMCYPPMGLPSANREVHVDPAPKLGPAHTTLVAVREAGAGDRKAAWRYWVDPQHGYAAVRVELESGGAIQVDGVIDKLKQSPQGTWYAYKMRRGGVRAAGEPLADKVVSGAEAGANQTTTITRWYLLDFAAKLPDELFAKPDKVVARMEPRLPKWQSAREAAQHAQAMNQLRRIAAALLGYQQVHGRFPPASLVGPDGKTRHSWRVAILPHLGYDELYRQYKLDEPWDSPANRQVLERMPAEYRHPAANAAVRETWCFAVVGPGTVLGSDKGTAITEITDEAHNTLLVVEAKRSVPWTKPEDVVVEGSATEARLGGYSGDVFLAAFADSSVRALPADMPREQLLGYATRDGGESLGSQR